jgi:hypothetical protein
MGVKSKSLQHWFKLVPIKRDGYKDVFAIESMSMPGLFVKDPGANNSPGNFELVEEPDVLNLPKDNEYLYFNIIRYHA